MTREIVCISCPIGCRLTVTFSDESEEIGVTGNRCSKGEEYGREEVLSPRRLVTATAALEGGTLRRLPVKSSRPVSKELIPQALEEIYRLELQLPVKTGQIVKRNLAGTGIDVVACRTVLE